MYIPPLIILTNFFSPSFAAVVYENAKENRKHLPANVYLVKSSRLGRRIFKGMGWEVGGKWEAKKGCFGNFGFPITVISEIHWNTFYLLDKITQRFKW